MPRNICLANKVISATVLRIKRWITNYRSGGIDELMSVVPRRKGSDIITSEIHEGLKSRVNNPRKGFLGYWDAKNCSYT